MNEDARRVYRRFAWGFIAAGVGVVASFLGARVVSSVDVDGRPETVGLFLIVVGEALRRTVRADEAAGARHASHEPPTAKTVTNAPHDDLAYADAERDMARRRQDA